MKSCSMWGSEAAAVGPMSAPFGSCGSLRQPMSFCPCSWMIRSNHSRHNSRCGESVGKKTFPTPYFPGSGSETPSSSFTTRLKNSWGSAVRIPAPSPVLDSHPQAPRCSICRRIRSASSMICLERSPLMCATKPIPQFSCSFWGSYKPSASGRIARGVIGCALASGVERALEVPLRLIPDMAIDSCFWIFI